MDENVLKSADRDENVENKVAPFTASEPPSEGQASDSKLQVVWCDSKLRDLLVAEAGSRRGSCGRLCAHRCAKG